MDKSQEMTIALDQWITEINEADKDGGMSLEAILASFRSLCVEFDIPEDVGHLAVARALGEPLD